MKGIVLSGGTGRRLFPTTLGISKQLLPVYDKPMIYYPLSIQMLAGIRDVLIISTPHDLPLLHRSLGDGSRFGMRLDYAVQERPRGIAEALTIGREFIDGNPVCLILGDNIFYGGQLVEKLRRAASLSTGCSLFGYRVANPGEFGIAEFEADGYTLRSIVEKPSRPRSNVAVTGLYFYDGTVCDICDDVVPSARGELEISAVNNVYLSRGQARLELLGRGYAWLDSGTHDSLLGASHFVQTIQMRQGHYIACLEEIAFANGWIDAEEVLRAAAAMSASPYGDYLRRLIDDRHEPESPDP